MNSFSDKFVEKIKTHILYSVTFFFLENRDVYEIMWEIIVERGRPQIAIWRMHFANFTPTATNTYSAYVIVTAFPQQQWLCVRVPM
jgi:hypothetical protein